MCYTTMGLQVMRLFLLLALSAFVAASVSENVVVSVPGAPVVVRLGHTATLPCWLNPPKNAESLEVRWYRGDHFDTPVLLHRERRLDYGPQDKDYVDRASFGLRDATSGGLKAGDVSLRLVNVTLKDAGGYTCYVSSDQGYDKATIGIQVTEVGMSPLLSPVWTNDNLVNVSCESEGWHPNPKLRWTDQKKALAHKGLVYNTDARGLVSVHSWLLVPPSSGVSCSIGLDEDTDREARVYLESLARAPENNEGSSSSGWVGWLFFAFALIALAIALGLYLKDRRTGRKPKLDAEENRVHAEEKQSLLLTGVDKEALEKARRHYENVTLEQPKNPYLKTVKDRIVREAPGDLPGGPVVTCITSIKGVSGFSSGQHYWEVALGDENVGFKKSWWIGVARANVGSDESTETPTASQGCWFLCSDATQGLLVNTEPVVFLPVQSTPQILGVYLDYDQGKLSFYNTQENRCIVTLVARFEGEVFPFFNPGKGDKGTIAILHKENGERTQD